MPITILFFTLFCLVILAPTSPYCLLCGEETACGNHVRKPQQQVALPRGPGASFSPLFHANKPALHDGVAECVENWLCCVLVRPKAAPSATSATLKRSSWL